MIETHLNNAERVAELHRQYGTDSSVVEEVRFPCFPVLSVA